MSDLAITTSSESKAKSNWFSFILNQLGLIGVLVLIVAGFSLTTPYFFTLENFTTIANLLPATLLISVGMTFVMIIGGIDLSVGSVLAFASAVIGLLVSKNVSFVIAAPVAILAGALAGFINGGVSVKWAIPSFITTLGMMEAARGATYYLTDSRTIYLGSKVARFAEITFLNLSLPFWIAIAVVLLGQLVLSRTVFGRHIMAVGSNEETARLCGINPARVRLIVFIIAGVLSAMAAIVEVSRVESANPNSGTGLELAVIAAVVIGGTSLVGGEGSVINSALGVAIVAVLGAGLAAKGARDDLKRIITGGVIVVAVIVDFYRKRLADKGSDGIKSAK